MSDEIEFGRFAQLGRFELHPWQKTVLEMLERGERRPVICGRRQGKRYLQTLMAAATIDAGYPLKFVATTPEAEEEMRLAALDLLEQADEREAL